MHPSSISNMQKALAMINLGDGIIVLEVGGRNIKPDVDRSYKDLIPCSKYHIADIEDAYNVTHLMPGPYDIPMFNVFVDLVVCGQTLEHVKHPDWLVVEMVRVLKPGGYIILIAPSAGPRHDTIDCWRFMDDAFKAITEDLPLEVIADWIDRDAPDERSRKWADHVFVGRVK